MRLDQFLAKRKGWSERTAREEIIAGRVLLNGNSPRRHNVEVSKFSEVVWKEEPIQFGLERVYLMVHKPVGILSATIDSHHKTIIDQIDHPLRKTLHLAGRLDRSSSGLLLLSNDGDWTSRVTAPENKLPKVYLVETDRPIPPSAVGQFREGFYFSTEKVQTRPAKLEILSEKLAKVTLVEGRYHQIKRMFHRIDGIRLHSLHRQSIGEIALNEKLSPGSWRALSKTEIESFDGPDPAEAKTLTEEIEK